MPTLELPPHVHELLETEARNHHLSPLDYLASRIMGIVPPRIGNGTYEAITSLVETFETTEEPDDFIKAIEENRAMRRQLAQERNP